MTLRLGTNLAALKTQRALDRSSEELGKTASRLASGQRIERASDDAAGLAISSSLLADSRIYAQGMKNVSEGVSLLNVAQAGLSALSEITVRQKVLAQQASNEVYSSVQRRALDDEANALTNEFNRIVSTTQYNGVSLLDGSLEEGIRIQAGYAVLGSVSISLGRELGRVVGDGTFTAARTFATYNDPRNVMTADLNGDGRLDAMVINNVMGSLSVLLGNGEGTFRRPVSYSVGGAPGGARTGDFNGDGFSDVVVVEDGPDTLSVLFGNGNGSFKARVSYSLGSGAQGGVQVSDINQDGVSDFVVGTSTGATILLGNGDGTYLSPMSQALGTGLTSLRLEDLDSDGFDDLIAVSSSEGKLSVAMGNGDGTFRARRSYTVSPSNRVILGDINGDGISDAVLSSSTSTTVRMLLGNGEGSFKFGETFSAAHNVSALSLADFNGDDRLDITLTTDDATNALDGQAVFLGDGRGSFVEGQTLKTGLDPQSTTVADINNDGVNDILTANYHDSHRSISVFLGNSGTTNFIKKHNLLSPQSAREALLSLEIQQGRISVELGVVGVGQSRLATVARNLQTSRENMMGAASRITDSDVAADAASLVALKIRQQIGSAIFAHTKQEQLSALLLIQS